jgi:Sec-independent protein translocase protein TatA
VRTFLLEEALPFAAVGAGVILLTLVFFGPPKRIKDASRSASELTPTTAASATRMEAAMSRAIDALRAARRQADATLPAAQRAPTPKNATAKASSAVPSAAALGTGTPLPGAAPVATITEAQSSSVLSAVSSLTDAVKAVREARTEEDFVRAEDRMRTAREQMQSACASGANGAFCESAKEMGSLGF